MVLLAATERDAVPFVIENVFVPPARTIERKEGFAEAPPEINGLPAEAAPSLA